MSIKDSIYFIFILLRHGISPFEKFGTAFPKCLERFNEKEKNFLKQKMSEKNLDILYKKYYNDYSKEIKKG